MILMKENINQTKTIPTGWSFSSRISANLILAIGLCHWLTLLFLGFTQTKVLTLALSPFSYISWIFALIFFSSILRIIIFDIFIAGNAAGDKKIFDD